MFLQVNSHLDTSKSDSTQVRTSSAQDLPSTEIKVIGAGFGRSSSTSVECALQRLGYNPAGGQITFWDNRSFLPTWLDWARGGSFEPCLQQTLQFGFNATTSDQPTGLAWKEFMLAFPDAKVLDIRHPAGVQGFVDSVEKDNFRKHCFHGQQELMSYFMDCCNFKLNFTDSYRREVCANDYIRTHDTITRTVPAYKLLTFTAADGWEPLANFLGLPVPDDDFPHLQGGHNKDCPW